MSGSVARARRARRRRRRAPGALDPAARLTAVGSPAGTSQYASKPAEVVEPDDVHERERGPEAVDPPARSPCRASASQS